MKQWANDSWAGWQAAATAITGGLAAGTKVATALGWRRVDALTEGDLVLTFDHGLQPLRHVQRVVTGGAAPQDWPLLVPAGALDNQTPVVVAGEQGVLLESDLAEAMTGDPFVVIVARLLEGHRGITRLQPRPDDAMIVLGFAAEQVVFTQAGVLAHCLPAGDMIDNLFSDQPVPMTYPVLSAGTARAYLAEVDRWEEAPVAA